MIKPKENPEAKQSFTKKAYKYIAILFVLYFTTAIVGSLIGRWIDNTFDVAPTGTIGTLLVSWIVALAFSKLLIDRMSKKDKSE